MINVTKNVKRVLVVEDESDFATMIASVLGKQGYDVTLASNGEDALREVKERKPDLITLDLQMPEKSGLHFYRQMKSSEKYRHTPVVVVTGLTRDDPEMKTLVRSFIEVDHLPSPEAYIEKPFDNQELVDVVRQTLASSRFCQEDSGNEGMVGN